MKESMPPPVKASCVLPEVGCVTSMFPLPDVAAHPAGANATSVSASTKKSTVLFFMALLLSQPKLCLETRYKAIYRYSISIDQANLETF